MTLPRRPDLIDRHADVSERVRKFELMNNPASLRPASWKPNREALSVITSHVILHSFFNCNQENAGPDFPPSLDPLGPRIHPAAFLLPPSPLDKQGWMHFLRGVGAIMGPQSVSPHPIADPSVDTEASNDLRGGPNFMPMTARVIGLPKGDWHWAAEGTVIGNGNGADGWPNSLMPDMNASLTGRDFGSPDPLLDAAYATGGYYNSDATELYASGEARWDFKPDPVPCDFGIGVGTAYDPYNYPGTPTLYNANPGPCYDHGVISNVDVHGFIQRLWIGIDPGDEGCINVEPDTDGKGNYYGQTTYPGFWDLSDKIAQAFSTFAGSVSGFYEDYVSGALARLEAMERYRWQPLHLYPGWYGRVEAHVGPDHRVYLRGKVTTYAGDSAKPNFAHWSQNLPQPRDDARSVAKTLDSTVPPGEFDPDTQVYQNDPMVVAYSDSFRSGSLDQGNGGSMLQFPAFNGDSGYIFGGKTEKRLDVVLDGVNFSYEKWDKTATIYVPEGYGN